jgi:hypothetical protein
MNDNNFKHRLLDGHQFAGRITNNIETANVTTDTVMHYQYTNKMGQVLRPFGPTIYKTKISDEMLSDMKDACARVRAKDLSEVDFRGNLTGALSDERFLMDEVSEDTLKEMQEWVAVYLGILDNVTITQAEDYDKGLVLESLWANYQKAFEWNPAHQHTGDVSFVIYIDNPVDIVKEMQHECQQGNGKTAGKIRFRFGETMPQLAHTITFTPEAGDMLIFPNWLEHQVFPFTEEGIERISVAGNYGIDATSPSGQVYKPDYKYNEADATKDD